MGHGIAYLFAAAGHAVGLFEPMTDIRASVTSTATSSPASFSGLAWASP